MWDWRVEEAPGAEVEEEGGQSWTDRSSPAERGARPASSVDSPVCPSAGGPGNAPRLERTDDWAWTNTGSE